MTTNDAVVVDTSAAVAILTSENGEAWLFAALTGARRKFMSTASYLELGIVIEARLGPTAGGAAGRFVRDAEVEMVDVDPVVAERALDGWRRFGKGRHPAGLNFGDCFTYALAFELGVPVLCVGDDFVRTDVAVLRPEG